ncbi:HNH endonuclease [Streptomyces sp. HNM0574]|nr:HNH endonuclease [Streptomyces sp. HNM0574]
MNWRDVRETLPSGTSREGVRAAVERGMPDPEHTEKRRDIAASQLYGFVTRMRPGHLVVARTDPAESNLLHIGVITGPVEPEPRASPCTRRRPVRWATEYAPLEWSSLPEELRSYLDNRRRMTLYGISERAAEIERLAHEAASAEEADGPGGFRLEGNRSRDVPARRRYRPEQGLFRERVLARYDGRCPLSGIGVPEMLEAAHLHPDAAGGSSDPGNGLLLNAALHRAFDAGLFAVHPETLAVETLPDGPGLADLGITTPSLPRARAPHPEALRRRYDGWRRGAG